MKRIPDVSNKCKDNPITAPSVRVGNIYKPATAIISVDITGSIKRCLMPENNEYTHIKLDKIML